MKKGEGNGGGIQMFQAWPEHEAYNRWLIVLSFTRVVKERLTHPSEDKVVQNFSSSGRIYFQPSDSAFRSKGQQVVIELMKEWRVLPLIFPSVSLYNIDVYIYIY